MRKITTQIEETKKFFIYARKSSEQDEKQALSIESQLQELNNFAKRENLTIIDVFTESKSARTPGRSIFNQMVSRIQNAEANGILSWHPDRLARNAVDAGKIVDLLDKGKLVSLKFPIFWFQNTPQGLFFINIAFGQSKYFSDNLSQNVHRGIRQKLRRGEYPSKAPVGYLNDLKTHTIVKDPQKFNAIKQAIKKYAVGKHGLFAISQFLAGKRIFGNRKNKPLSISRMQRLLTNPFYYGHFRYKDELHEGTHEPMISKKLFDQVQKTMKQRGRKTRSRDKLYAYPFRGLMKCGECGYSITAEKKIKFYKTLNKEQKFIYYRCTKKASDYKCQQPFISQKQLTKQINKQLRKVSLSKDWAGKMLNKLKEEKQNYAQSLHAFVCEKKQELKKLEDKMEKLLDSYLDGILLKDEYQKKKEKLLNKKVKIDEFLSSSKQKQNHWLGPFKEWILTASTVNLIARSENLEEKASFLQKTGSNFILKDKKLDISWQKPWALLTQRPIVRNVGG